MSIKKQVFSIFFFTFLVLTVVTEARAVEYELPDLNGNVQSFEQYKGKWVVVNYWATWCKTCLKEIPDLIEFHKNNKDKNIVVVGINFESIKEEQLKKFVADKNIPFMVLNAEPAPKTPLGRVPALPTTYIINPQGKVIAGEIGIVPSEALEAFIMNKQNDRQANIES